MRIILVGLVLLCGCEKSESDMRREQAQLSLNRLVDAIMSQKTDSLKDVLSAEQLAVVAKRAESAGVTVDETLRLEYESQKRGLIMNFGEEWLSKNKVEVSSVKELGDNLFEVSIAFNGERAYGKPVYFSLEGDEFRFAGITPHLNPTAYAAAGIGYFWWNHWKFNNFGVGYGGWVWGDFYCSDSSYSNVFFVVRLGRSQSLEPANCFSYEYWYGAKKTFAKIYVPDYSGYGLYASSECMYNAIGSDVMLRADGHWQCTPP